MSPYGAAAPEVIREENVLKTMGKSANPYIPPKASQRLAQGSQRLTHASLMPLCDWPSLSEVGPGLSEVVPGLSEVGPGLSEVGPGISEVGPGFKEAGACLSEASQRYSSITIANCGT